MQRIGRSQRSFPRSNATHCLLESPKKDESMNIKSALTFSRTSDDALLINIMGEWKLANKLPTAEEVRHQIESGPNIRRITFDTKELKDWDSGLLTFLSKVNSLCFGSNILIEKEGLPQGIQRLLSLASAVPERKGARREKKRIAFLARIGASALDFWGSTLEMLAFIGEAFTAIIRMVSGKARFRGSDLFLIIQESGAQALPIVSLISILVGLILAFVGAIQLRMFGAQIYVANLVGIAMIREMAAIMTGIIMAGRTGAAFAAQLGTMQVNEEIDALKTMGFSPMDFLILPRMLALFLMMPLLCLYADVMGVLGGLVVGFFVLDLNFMEYYIQTCQAVRLNDLYIGLFMSAVFGVLVALSGCLRGIQCGRSASAVGEAATSAVVTGIVSVIVATAIITVICDTLGI
jgi:phospholipid/cholesterol/gamma-HCH transport system permease protein